MFGVILTSRGSPATRRSPRSRSGHPLPATGDDGPGRPRGTDRRIAPGPADRPSAAARAEDLPAEVPKIQEGRHRARPPPPRHGADLHRSPQLRRPERPRRDPRPAPGCETAGLDRIPVTHGSDADSSRGTRLLSREQEAHLFRKMNFLKHLARRIRDRIDPDSPVPADLDEVERLQVEALKLKNQLVETNLRLVVSVAKKRNHGLLRTVRPNQRRHLRPDATPWIGSTSPGATDSAPMPPGRSSTSSRNATGGNGAAASGLRRCTMDSLATPESESERTSRRGPRRAQKSGRAAAPPAGQARAVDHGESPRDRRRPRANAQADRHGPGDQQGTRPPARRTRPRQASGFRPH